MTTDIVLTTLNARYIHAAFGLRYLKANLHEFEACTEICEFTLEQRPLDIVEQILARQPKIVGLGVYIWNATLSFETAALLKRISPETILVLGGPEVSYEQSQQAICQLADHVLSGPAEASFYKLCQEVVGKSPAEMDQALSLGQLKLPYYLYSDEDLAHRILYVEASRGCPFKCEFCLSALDKTAKAFPLDKFLAQMEALYQRGARQFKFVDRTFNLSTKVSLPIMQFFLDRMSDELFVHFEVIPDRLPSALKAIIAQFPPGSLQFEVGVQTFNPHVQAIIQRKQDNDKTRANLAWLCEHSPAHIHADLIFGLPGETLQSIAESFDLLVTLNPDEIQLGILKRLRGMPMVAQAAEYELVFSPNPPYDILSTRDIHFADMQRLRRLARYWDLIANSGRFKHSLNTLLSDSPFEHFMRLSEWLHETTGQTHKISLKRLFDLLYQALTQLLGMDANAAKALLQIDFERSGMRGLPQCLLADHQAIAAATPKHRGNKRQLTHLG